MFNRIGIIGDVHAEDEHLRQALEFLHGADVDVVLCTGDIVDGKGDPNRCCELLQAHAVKTVRGNHDRWLLENKARHVPNAHFLEDLGRESLDYIQALPTQITIETRSGELMLCHGVADNDLQKIWPGTERMPVERSKRLDEIIASETYTFMINGHMHYRTMINFCSLTLLNAGTLRGEHHPGFSILDCAADTLTGYEFYPELQQVRQHPLLEHENQVFDNTQAFEGDWTPVTLYA